MAHRPASSRNLDPRRACADRVEATLKAAGVTLTMGGEPTYIPHDPVGEEWGTAALGPTKLPTARIFAGTFLRRFYPGALVTQFYGKQYPNEPLPRWTLSVSHRPGKPLWPDTHRLLLDKPATTHSPGDVATLAQKLATSLGLASFLRPGREVGSPKSRAKGWILPLDFDKQQWISHHWNLPPGEPVTLIPGDSSMGLRLPLGDLPDTFLKRAMTLEVKDGGLEIFLPPLASAPYFVIVDIIHGLARTLDLKDLIISGYFPLETRNLVRYTFASDPGVIEVNLPPAPDWKTHQSQLDRLDLAAAEAGLRTVKYHFNGFTQGTGGGAHICFGGPAAKRSPFLTRRNFLPGVLRYFQNHPSLAYAFTGMFVGPSSQAPRVDETGVGVLHELELALDGTEKVDSDPFLFALLFRDLLADRSGNTHRAEISIDKMWNPSSPTGTMGIIEFRAIETAADGAMLGTIALLLRAILARVARHPYHAPLVSWGDSLHDRFFLPSLLWEDLEKVIRDLADHHIPFQQDWLSDFWRWRFPLFGTLGGSSGRVTVRHALEAWPLLGEQPAGATTARAIDASNERVEFTTSASDSARHALLVGGIELPLRRVGHRAIAGLTFRAHYRVPSLHPHILSQSPLLLEWVDRKTGRVIDAAEWHSWRPNGEPYDSRPQDASEAAQRVQERWIPLSRRIGRHPKIRQLPTASNTSRWTHDLRTMA